MKEQFNSKFSPGIPSKRSDTKRGGERDVLGTDPDGFHAGSMDGEMGSRGIGEVKTERENVKRTGKRCRTRP